MEQKILEVGKEAAVPAVIAGSTAAAALGLEAITDHAFTLYGLGATISASLLLHYSEEYVRHVYFHEDPHTPRQERVVLDTIIGAMIAVEAAAATGIVTAAPFVQQPETYLEKFGIVGAALSAGYVTGKYILPAIGNFLYKKAEMTKMTIPIIPAALGLLWAYNHVQLVASTPIEQITPENTTRMEDPIPIEIPEIPTTPAPLTKIQEITYSAMPPFTIWPVKVEEENRLVTSCFEWRGEGVTGGRHSVHHHGIDIKASQGSSALVIGNGVVKAIESEWGNVIVDHGDKLSSSYGHLDTIAVKVGDKLLAGDTIGTVGGRGIFGRKQYKPHLHLQIIDDNMPQEIQTGEGQAILDGNINPLYVLTPTLNYRVANNKGCRAQGGPWKFFEDYTVFENPARLGRLQGGVLSAIRQAYGQTIDFAAQEENVNVANLYATIAVESGGNMHATSSSGAKGLGQFIENTAYVYGLCDNRKCKGRDDRTNPEKAIPAIAHMQRNLMNHYARYTAQLDFANAAYNAGTDLVDKAIARTGSNNPSLEQFIAVITPEFVAEVAPRVWFRNGMTVEKKTAEIRSHIFACRAYRNSYEKIKDPVSSGI